MSKQTVASLIALGVASLLLGLTVLIVYVDQRYIAGATGRRGSESLTAKVTLLSSYALPAISFLGVLSGIASVYVRGNRDQLAWLGLIGNVLILVLVGGVILLSMLFAGYGATP